MTLMTLTIDGMLKDPRGPNFGDLPVDVKWATEDPFVVRFVFHSTLEWVMDVGVFFDAAEGISSGRADVVWTPARTVRRCMNLHLESDSGRADIVFSTGDLARIRAEIERLMRTHPDLNRENEFGMSVRVEMELDRAIARILEG